jgi:heat shock protein beta
MRAIFCLAAAERLFQPLAPAGRQGHFLPVDVAPLRPAPWPISSVRLGSAAPPAGAELGGLLAAFPVTSALSFCAVLAFGARAARQCGGDAAAEGRAAAPGRRHRALLTPAGKERRLAHGAAGFQRTSPGSARRGGGVRMQAGTAEAEAETYEFEAEVAKVMDIIINSLYSDKDIFLRELVSNASDACDKKRFLRLTDESAGGYDGKIRITGDKELNLLTIEDNGVGMTRKELKTNLGRIAQSGTKKFTEALGKENSDAKSLIGQFGVGFYSAFLVADKVEVVTKAEGEPQLRWESESANKYTITPDDSAPIEGSGTRLILHLKEEADKYIDDYTLRGMLKKYSEFISFPIELWAEKTDYVEVLDDEAEQKEGEEPKMKTVPQTSKVWETVNSAKPLWMRDPKEVDESEYDEFYKTTFKAYDTPAAYSHFALEGQVEFRAMLFCPSTLPWELSQDMFSEQNKPMKLFVKRVFISDEFQDKLLPRWLSFLKGMVDSEDLPLNVSRELVQKSKVISIIAKRLVRKAIDMFVKLQKDEKKFEQFTDNFGRYIKVGVIEDRDNKDKLLELACFASSKAEKSTTLPGYVSRMPEEQKQIYYLSGASKAMVASSPVLERLRKKGFEVIYALDQIDEIALQGVDKFQDFDVIDAAKENADLGEMSEEEKKEAEEAKEELKATTEFLKKVLATRVDKVEVSGRLEESPAALVQPQFGMSPQMQRFMRAQAAAQGTDDPSLSGMAANLEINPKHPVVLRLKEMVSGGDESPVAQGFAELLYDVAAVSSGYELNDTAAFAKRVVALMSDGEDALADLVGAAPGPESGGAPGAASDGDSPGDGDDSDEPIVPEVM